MQIDVLKKRENIKKNSFRLANDVEGNDDDDGIADYRRPKGNLKILYPFPTRRLVEVTFPIELCKKKSYFGQR